MSKNLFGVLIDDITKGKVLKNILVKCKEKEFEYLVTPNVDHLIRYYESKNFRKYYSDAFLIINDSKILSFAMRIFKKEKVRSLPGSDITKSLFDQDILNRYRVAVVGCHSQTIKKIESLYGGKFSAHIYPEYGFEKKLDDIDHNLSEIEKSNPEILLFCIGSPKQEMLAYNLKKRKNISGFGLCVGASLMFLSGEELRAPSWVNKIGMEWFFRFIQSPKRLFKRYFIIGPKVILIFLGMKGYKCLGLLNLLLG